MGDKELVEEIIRLIKILAISLNEKENFIDKLLKEEVDDTN